jgi:hypothetical protein
MFRIVILMIGLLAMPFMGQWGSAALALLALWAVLDSETQIERLKAVADSKAPAPGFGRQQP